MNQISSPEENEQLYRISFANLKQFSCSTPVQESSPTRAYSTSRKNKIIVRFPTEIFQLKDFQHKQSWKSTKKLNLDSQKSIKFPRLENKKKQKQKRNLSTMLLRQKQSEQHLIQESPNCNLLQKINPSKNRLYINQIQKKIESKLKFNNYMKLFTGKKGKQENK